MGQANLELKRARVNVGLTQDDVARKLSIGVKTYSGWECGDHKPYLRHRRELAPILNISIGQVNALFGDDGFPSGNDGTSAGIMELNDASEYREEQNEYLQSHLGSRLLGIVDAGTYSDQCKAFALVTERFDAMNTENPSYEMTRRQAVMSLATFPFAPPINLEKRERVASSHYELFLQECGASLAACEELAKSSDPDDLALAFRCVCRYLVELQVISDSLSRYRQQALELAAHCAILKARLGWDCIGKSAAILFAQDAIRISRESGDVCLQLSAHSKLSWFYLHDHQRELALDTAIDARGLLEKYKERLPICIWGGTYSTLSVMQARNGLDPDIARKKAIEQGPAHEVLYFMDFTRGRIPIEQGDALYYAGKTGGAIQAYTQIIDPKTLKATRSFKEMLTESSRITTLLGMSQASMKGDARDKGNAIRYWKEAVEAAKRIKSEGRYSRALSLHDIMGNAFPDDKEVYNLRDHFRRGKRWK